MLRTICKQIIRPTTTLNISSSKYKDRYQRRVFCSNVTKFDHGGLSVDDTKVLNYLNNAKTEHDELIKRKESLGRAGHEKIKELQQMVEIYDCRNAVIENLKILNEEMAKEKDTDLLTMMKDEKKVHIVVNESTVIIVTNPIYRSKIKQTKRNSQHL